MWTNNYNHYVSGVTDTGSHTWTERNVNFPVETNDGNEAIDEWSTIAPTAGTFTITVAESSSSSHYTTAIAIAISGANTANPFDAHSGLPYNNFGTSGTPSVSAVTTTSANDILLGLVGFRGTSTSITAASGYTLITSQTYTGSQQWGAAEYKIVTSAQSSATVTWGNNPGSNDWAMIVDAVQRAW